LSVYHALDRTMPHSGATGYGPPLSHTPQNVPFFRHSITVFQCPSDMDQPGSCNARCNLGTGPSWIYRPDATPEEVGSDRRNGNGAFAEMRALRPAVFTDGLSNTVFFSERVIGDGDGDRFSPWRDYSQIDGAWPANTAENLVATCAAASGWTPHASYSGFSWLYAAKSQTGYDHMQGPNARIPDCAPDSASVPGSGHSTMAARSQHPGLVNVVFGDAAVQSVSETIDLAVWQAWGTREERASP
jgi:hypothetical protein